MDHNTPKTWIHSALGKELAEASIRRQTDRDARRLSLSTDELRHHAEAVEGNASSSREALTRVFPNGLRANRSIERTGQVQGGCAADRTDGSG